MKRDELVAKLKQLYDDASKHARYQNVPEFVRRELGYREPINEEWRGDTARYGYLQGVLDLSAGQAVGDVGANTGFFTLSLARERGDCRLTAYEPHPGHAEFIRLVVEYFSLRNVRVERVLLDLAHVPDMGPADVLLLLNVLHHAGFDFDPSVDREPAAFADYAVEYLARLRPNTERLVFQMGTNQGGSKQHPLVDSRDEPGKLRYQLSILNRAGWTAERVALARKNDDGRIDYLALAPAAVEAAVAGRDGEVRAALEPHHLDRFPGEFYRRPLWICRKVRRPEEKHG